MYELLDPIERSRAARFRNERDRRRFVVARGTLRMLLGEYAVTAPQRVPLCVLPGGKPALGYESATRGLHFNLSHCGELALFAFADRDVGIDVERLARHSDMGRVAAHFFSPEEAVAFRRLVGIERARFFYRTWVRKEAYVKATGEGFALDPSRVSIATPAGSGITLHDEAGTQRVDAGYSVHDLRDVDDHVSAVAVARYSGAPAIHYREMVS
jgi:4'-phosphopantetheinyl transferase